MIGRRSTIGFALLWAFAFCAFAAQGAMAQVGTKAVNTTAVTCVEGGGNEDFKDAHCDEFVGAGKGEYGHVAISNETTTELELANESSFKFNGVTAGINTEFICKKTTSVAGKSFIHNVEASGKHTVTGTAQINLTECEVIKPIKCAIKQPIILTSTFEGVEGLNGKGEMGIEFRGEGAESIFAELTFENKGAEKCVLVNGGKAFLLRGSMIATGNGSEENPCEGEIAKPSGATWVLEDGNEMETLEIGFKKVSLVGTFTASMASGGNPIALTTVT